MNDKSWYMMWMYDSSKPMSGEIERATIYFTDKYKYHPTSIILKNGVKLDTSKMKDADCSIEWRGHIPKSHMWIGPVIPTA
jgi:hypothetical protein